MWAKSEQRQTAADTPVSSPLTHPTASPSHSANSPATVSQGIRIKGEVSGQGDFFVDGELEGKICLPEGTLTVGPNARVTAEIEARQIIVRGEVLGSLKAHERIQILSTAKVTGDMDARGLAIEDGAELHGKVATPRAAVIHATKQEGPLVEVAKSTADQPAETPHSEPSQSAKGA